LFEKTKIFLGEVRTEMSKVVWPSKELLKTYTIVTITSVAIGAMLLGIWDIVLSKSVAALLGIQ